MGVSLDYNEHADKHCKHRKESTVQTDGPGICIYPNSRGNQAQCMCDSLAVVSLSKLGSEDGTIRLKPGLQCSDTESYRNYSTSSTYCACT